MPLLTCHYPGGYSGMREPGGNPRLLLDLAEGQTAEVSDAKAAQLLRDFPGYFTTDRAPAPRAAAAATTPDPEPPATEEAPEATDDDAPATDDTTEAAPRRRQTRRK